tara:strand:+ start:2141 stop:2272 length:132 start_codon:yes stop_codon:yes gene_type:complete
MGIKLALKFLGALAFGVMLTFIGLNLAMQCEPTTPGTCMWPYQ